MKKFTKILFFLSVVIFPQIGKAQLDRQWVNEYTTPDTAYMNVIGLFDAGNGNVVKATMITKFSPPETFSRFMLQKISPSGATIWEEIYEHPQYQQFSLSTGGIDQNGNTYFSGQISVNQQEANWFVISFDADGNERWQKGIVENLYSSGGSQKCITDALGNTYASGNVGTNGLSLGAIVKYDNLGNEEWVKYDTSSYTYGADMLIAANGDLIACDGHFEFTRFAPNGQILWNTPDTAGFIYVTPKIAEAPDGSIYGVSFYGFKYLFKKLNSTGVFQWSYNDFSENLVFGDYTLNVLADAQNNIYLSGLNSTEQDEYRAAVFKFNPNATEIWRQEFITEMYDISDMILLPNGNPVVAASQWTGGPYYSAVYLLDGQTGAVVDSDSLTAAGVQHQLLFNHSGLYLAGTGDFSTALAHYSGTLSVGEKQENLELLVYPNPFSTELKIKTDLDNATFECTDISGKTVSSGNLEENATIELLGLAPGTYILNVKGKNGQFGSRRVVKL